jgi:uncharacterized caspase-like protein
VQRLAPTKALAILTLTTVASRALVVLPLLAPVIAPQGVLIAYATAPGQTAADGDGLNGLYTTELIRHMLNAHARIEEIFLNTRLSVLSQSGGKQIPWESSSLKSRYIIQP